MVFFNYSTMQMAAKVVYYGPGLCGKTTNLQWIFEHTSTDSRGEMVSLATETDRTLFFDLLPIDVGSIAGFSTKIQLYTVPGQVFYNTTRKLVLKGVDGVVFVADSQRPMLQANIESFQNLEENLAEMGLSLDTIPLVLQYNKRDLPNICSTEELDQALNRQGWASIEASALNGDGVFETLKMISKTTLLALKKRLTKGRTESATGARPRPAPAKKTGATAAPAAAGAPGRDTGPMPRVAPSAAAREAKPPPATGERPAVAPQAGESPAPPPQGAATTEGPPKTAATPAVEPAKVEPPKAEATTEAPPKAEPPKAEAATAPEPAKVEPPAPAPPEPATPSPATPEPVPPAASAAPAGSAAMPAAKPTPEPQKPARRRKKRPGFDALAELEKLRRQTVRGKGGKKSAVVNGKGEINRDFRMTLKRSDFSRAQRFSLILQLEDADRQVVDEARHLHVEIDNPGSLEGLLLRLNIDLNASS